MGITKSEPVSGIGVREIGRRWGTSGAYVSQFLKKAGLKPLPGGGYDLVEATRLRACHTVVGRGQKRWARSHPEPIAGCCEGCGSRYIVEYARNCNTPSPDQFCSASCEADAAAGFTTAQIVARREKGTQPKNIKFVTHSRWMPPTKPAPVVRVCMGCGGRYDLNSDEARDPYCSEVCQCEVKAGLSAAEIRRHLKITAAEGGASPAEIQSPGFFDEL